MATTAMNGQSRTVPSAQPIETSARRRASAIVLEDEFEMDVRRSFSGTELEEENLRLTCVATPASGSLRLVYNAKYLDRLQDRVV